MLEKLKARWKVNSFNLVLVLATFSLGGSLCGYAGRKLLLLTNLEKGVIWVVLYIILVTLLWPLCVLLISIPLGQFGFFKNYILKIWGKMSGKTKRNRNINIAIFASGAGTNAQQIINKFSGSASINIALIVCNKPGAGVLAIAEKAGIPALIIEKDRFINGDHYIPELQKHNIGFIVLAGFFWKMPSKLVQAFPKRIINIHPALLPGYGGKGMFGTHVHEAVIASGDPESGITIHYVDEQYDHGEIIFQARCTVDQHDTPETLAQKIHALEHIHYPKLISAILQ